MPSNRDTFISLRDLLFYIKKNKNFILRSVILGTLFFIAMALTKPVVYHSKASFIDRGKSNGTLDPAAFILGNKEPGTSVYSLVQSERILKATTLNLGLQAKISPSSEIPFFWRPYYHLQNSWAQFQQTKTPIFADPLPPFRLRNLSYNDEKILSLDLFLKGDGTFLVEEPLTGAKMEGNEGFPLTFLGIVFTLERTKEAKEGLYQVHLFPIVPTISELKKSVVAESSKKNSNLILLECYHPSRETSALILNTLMAEVENELKTLEKEGTDKQIAILETRQNQSFNALSSLLHLRADVLTKDFNQLGFIDSEKAIAFYVEVKSHLEKELLRLNFEKRALEETVKLSRNNIEILTSISNVPFLQKPIQKMRELQTKRDSLSLAILHETKPSENNFSFATWDRFEKGKNEIKQQLTNLEKTGAIEQSNLPFLGAFKDLLNHKENDPLASYKREGCKNTLLQLAHLYEIEENTLRQAPYEMSQEFSTYEGIPSQLSFELLLAYQKNLDETQEKSRQLSYLIDEFEKQDLPLSAIASSLSQQFLKEFAEKIIVLESTLIDPKNRSQKEQDRIRDELELERHFLKGHLKGLFEILTIRSELLKEKMSELRKVTLSGLYQELSILQNEILEGMTERIQRISEEEALLIEEKNILLEKMAPLPHIWVEETILNQKRELQQHLFREITTASASKELASQLNLVLSSPLDKGITPLLPVDPNLLLFSILGGFSGFFLSVTLLLIDINRKGLPASPTNLKNLGYSVLELPKFSPSTSLNNLPDQQLDALRLLFRQLKKTNLFISCPPSIPPLLAELSFKTTSSRPLLIDLEGTPNFFGKPSIQPQPSFDTLLLPQDRFLSDYLLGEHFNTYLTELAQNYPLILAYSLKRSELFSPLFEKTILSVDSTPIDTLDSFFPHSPLFLFFQ
jgi:uncharacterized protein involved in exopolysaccharide biosynthesis